MGLTLMIFTVINFGIIYVFLYFFEKRMESCKADLQSKIDEINLKSVEPKKILKKRKIHAEIPSNLP